jgi:hypothetical protein
LALRRRRLRLTLRGSWLALLRLLLGSRRLLFLLTLWGLPILVGLGCRRSLRQDQGVAGQAIRSRSEGQNTAGEQKGSRFCHIYLP